MPLARRLLLPEHNAILWPVSVAWVCGNDSRPAPPLYTWHSSSSPRAERAAGDAARLRNLLAVGTVRRLVHAGPGVPGTDSVCRVPLEARDEDGLTAFLEA